MTSFLERVPFRRKLPAAILALAPLLASPVFGDVAVVTAEATAINALEEAQARALWLGTIERVAGIKLTVADRSDSEIRAEFYSRVLHKTRGQVKAIRAKRAFQHGIAPPPELPSDESVLKWIRARPNRLGYVDAESVGEERTVKILLIIQVPERREPP